MTRLILKAFSAAFVLLTSVAVPAQTAQGSFTDDLGDYDSVRWMKADGWANGAPFNNAWLADHVNFASGAMSLRLDNTRALGKRYSSGQYQSKGFHSYGCYEARFKPVARSGVVNSFFTYAGPYDNGGNGRHNEIDIEFLGNNMRRFQVNFWTNDDANVGGNEHFVDLPFDASLAYHQYAFKWTTTGIEWFVDGVSVYQVLDSAPKPTPKAVDSLHKIMMNVWPVDSTAAGWAGTFIYPGTPLTGQYDWIKYTSGEDCAVSVPETVGTAITDLHVQGITMAIINKKTQVSSRITVLNGQGQPVQSAAVTGAWSGAINSGATQGLTDSAGAVTLTSATVKANTTGNVTFCVSSIAAAGMSYVSAANLETCHTIAK